ncbi:hypothetical protein [Maritalea sp.]|jgi:hypothetical protein|uniref:hypothetical protein n=1 Tax=Maritalea sp. TaxID=2003361 RepID=UPI0039E29E7C
MNKSIKKYTFKIKGFTPDQLPFDRLVEYYAEIKKMLDVAEHLYLVGVFEGSHASSFSIDPIYESKLTRRLDAIRHGTAPANACRAHDTINKMLQEDGTSGALFGEQGQNVLQFPGKQADTGTQMQIRDVATITGELYYLAASESDVKVRVKTGTYGAVYCSTTREIATGLKDFLFNNVKVNGRGLWTKTSSGEWRVDEFVITDFAPVQTENLRATINRIRELELSWPKDPLNDIREVEEKGGQIH